MEFLPKTKLKDPISYMEIEGYDCRVAVSKTNDFSETLGDANLSLIYSNSKEYKNNDREKLLVRRIHLRHAILNLNSCYDLLLQIPWFYYRVWRHYNTDGKLRTKHPNYQNKEDIVRNDEFWVQRAEEFCSPAKLLKFFKKEHKYNHISKSLTQFYNSQIKYSDNTYSIRFLANQIKHNHSIIFKELYQKPSFNLNINNENIDLSNNLFPMLTVDFYNLNNPDEIIGKQVLTYTEDLFLDIHYTNGDTFLAKDYINKNRMYSMDEVHDKLIKFHTALLELYEIIISDIQTTLSHNPWMNEPKITSTTDINMDKYFKNNI